MIGLLQLIDDKVHLQDDSVLKYNVWVLALSQQSRLKCGIVVVKPVLMVCICWNGYFI